VHDSAVGALAAFVKESHDSAAMTDVPSDVVDYQIHRLVERIEVFSVVDESVGDAEVLREPPAPQLALLALEHPPLGVLLHQISLSVF
jgi:hypothetical protein